MDFVQFDQRIMELIRRQEFSLAETELHQAKLQAFNANDHNQLEHVLSWLLTLYLRKQPPDLVKAELYCLERERVAGTAYAKLQYAMTLYWSLDDPARTVTKAREAIATGREEGDDKTVYQSLGLLGVALLDLHYRDEAIRVLYEIEKMIAARLRIVVGDETLFLERLQAETEEAQITSTIQGIAKTLAPVCREPEFAIRLKRLAES